MKSEIYNIAAPLVRWYRQHERAFPWREDPSPYRVWVSEIMLQQTRIEAALPYFERFVQTLPTVHDLANASEDVLLKLWEGLGYYSRVRNLQKAAKIVVAEYGGELPDTYEKLLTLPGIGEYTAGAIASIAFGKSAAAVDGNVLRVFARLTDDPTDVMQPKNRKRLSELVRSLVPQDDPGAFNQGIMELGETVCLPNTQPRCHECPLAAYCAVCGTPRARELPLRTPPKPRKTEKKTVFLVVTDDTPPRILLHRREDGGLLGGMWEFPSGETVTEFTDAEILSTKKLPPAKHVFSHIEWHMSGQLVKVKSFTPKEAYCLLTKDEFISFALPTAFRKYRELLFEEDVL